MNIRYLIKCLLDVVYCNVGCVICGDDISEEYLCDKCKKKVLNIEGYRNVQIGDTVIRCYSAVYYDGIIKDLIKKLKYKSDFNSGRVLSQYMEKKLKDIEVEYDIITYVPMHEKDLRKRGFNQSKFLSVLLNNKKSVDVLYKNKLTENQKVLSKEERWRNLEGCFELKKGVNIKSKRIILVDDVITSGATIYFCCKELIEHGADEVIVLTASSAILKNTRL